MSWRERINVDSKILVGKPVIKGTRIAVDFVVELLAGGWSVKQVLEEYDHLTAADIQACLAYASDILRSERIYPLPKRVRVSGRSAPVSRRGNGRGGAAKQAGSK